MPSVVATRRLPVQFGSFLCSRKVLIQNVMSRRRHAAQRGRGVGARSGEVEPSRAPIESGFGGTDFVASARRHYDETCNTYDNSARRQTEQRGNRWVLLAAGQNGSDADVQGAN